MYIGKRLRFYVLIASIGALFTTACSRSNGFLRDREYKIGDNIDLTYWAAPWADFGDYEHAGEFPLYQELEKLTGVRVRFRHPTQAEARSTQQMLAILRESDDMPDIIELDWTKYEPGGAEQAIEDGVILRLNKHLEPHAPNLWKLISGDEELARWISAIDGSYYVFPCIQPIRKHGVFVAALFKEDWLQAVGKQVPNTLSEWHDVLTAFKNHDFKTFGYEEEFPLLIQASEDMVSREIDIPFLDGSSLIAGSFGISHGFFYREGDILYGPLLPEYQDMLQMFARWYSEDLIHPYFADPQSDASFSSLLIKSGVWIGYLNTTALAWEHALLQAQQPLFEGRKPIGNLAGPTYLPRRSAAVSASSTYQIEAIRWLDIGYSLRGNLLYNYGIEGKTYIKKKRRPVLTSFALSDMRTNFERRASRTNILLKYARGSFGGPYVHSTDLYYQENTELKLPIPRWDESPIAEPWIRPEAVLRQFPDEAADFYAIMGEIRQYRNRSFIEFVTGKRSLEEFPEFVRTLKTMGIEKAREILIGSWRKFYEKPIQL